ncbi:deoxycytidylate deaminase [Aricia agestis]|uniref:deoxycytidylate deaminase n=1 Tax=Aricia agestis TaxID=91739 RepID=UPI001C20A0C8|nr:deoxycytidylate deaminase [Aricia agestis]
MSTTEIEDLTAKMSINSQSVKKREDYIDWQEYFMAIAFLAAKRSKDPSYQVGACVVNKDNKIVGIGYNGMPIGCSDDDFPWGKRTECPLDDKHLYVCHAEMNAILNKNSAEVKNCAIYVGLFPCNECAKIIIQSGITEVVYLSDEKRHKKEFIASKKMFDAAGIKYTQFIPKRAKIEINFTGIDWDSMSPSK